ncbi:hypothetical protein DFH08DRAFT_925287 [Mycena albidolilacea]|uniref:Uncharacterized protein n=1 Tax=Mycena albidolilacea TaxID=1033008 RepID=A0AAD7EPE7_9AGAR|nr:hypothetical protein DFH08DRAFT_925287 [Mycena albidolilacea]
MDRNPAFLLWPPNRTHTTPSQAHSRSSSVTSVSNDSSVPGTPVAAFQPQKQYRNGYEVTPKATPSPFKPYTLRTPGTPTLAAFNLSNSKSLEPMDCLDPSEWTKLAIQHGLILATAHVHGFQFNVANQSLTWVLPLIARKEGVSLVITPYTSLGLEGEFSSNHGKIKSIFIFSEQNAEQDFETAATGDMLVVFVCLGMLETIYLDEAHLPSWRPSYSWIYILREIVGLDVPLICLSATYPKSFSNVLVPFAGLKPDYILYNKGNFREELSTIVLTMEHGITSFLDIAFILPLGCQEADLVKTLIYVDNIELLTKMFWWACQRAAPIGLRDYVIDIVHSGLSVRHQEIFRRVVQYKCYQHRGRGTRCPGEFAPSMLEDHISVENPKSQDPGIIELIKSDECVEAIIQRCLENESWSRDPSFPCCNRCTPDLWPAREFRNIGRKSGGLNGQVMG